ncbi:hypothetical protein MGMO_54c00210 [Methyloglobulus morosus KoM1]|uniref:Uncharacterized protein n=1 Tax=Methyloglobulus morosus KoM1 TaxID=1116472 RepID=V5C260_9GAMM|nr:hypothetical protein [Methyloglobulus morosus]ESS72532.1 hypothetical protein MGMO_54c00210 [Methyloglobulus morosus KoM1]
MSHNSDNQDESRKSVWVLKDSLQKLSLALLPFAIALASYAFLEYKSIYEKMDTIPSQLKEYAVLDRKFHREMASMNSLSHIMERSRQWYEMLNNSDFFKESSFAERSRASWYTKISLRRSELKHDQGSLHQFDANIYPHLHVLATSVTSMLQNEDDMLNHLLQFHENQTKDIAKLEERLQYYQKFDDILLEVIRDSNAYVGSLKAFGDEIESMKDENSLKYDRMSAVLKSYEHSLLINRVLLITSGICVVLLSCGALGLPKRKKESESSRIIVP